MSLSSLIADLNEIKDKLHAILSDELERMPEVIDVGETLSTDDLPSGDNRNWHRASNVVAVVADLKGSTQLGVGKHQGSTAGIIQAATGGIIETFRAFNCDYVQAQGDGGFALFWGELSFERAVCSAITVKTYGAAFTKSVQKKWNDSPTGMKVGIASGTVLARRVGYEKSGGFRDPVWVGKPVNYAAKCAQQCDRGELVVTGSVWDWIAENSYLTHSCGCHDSRPVGEAASPLWDPFVIDNLVDGDAESQGMRLGQTTWCDHHGAEFCESVLTKKPTRVDVGTEVYQQSLTVDSVDWTNAQVFRKQDRRKTRSR